MATLGTAATWPASGGNSLNGASSGQLVPFSQQDRASLLIQLQADLKTNPNARLLLTFGSPAQPSSAIEVLTDGQSATLTVSSSAIVYWALVDSSNAAVIGGAQDYLRASVYL